MKRVLIVLVVVVLGVLGWMIYARLNKPAAQAGAGRAQGAAVAVELAPVRTASIRDVGRFTGSLLPKAQFIVAPKVAGRLEKLTVDVGDRVKLGDVIALLDEGEYAQQVAQAQAEVNVANASVDECKSALDLAVSDLKRVKTLGIQKIASPAELEEAEARQKVCDAKYTVALAQVQQTKASLEAAKVRLSYTRIVASWPNGQGENPAGEGAVEKRAAGERVVGERFVDEGAMLQANTPIVTILDNSSMRADIYVIERDYPKLQIGQTVDVSTDAFPGRVFAGRVARIAPLLKESSRQAQVQIEIPNPGEVLKPGMFVRTQIEFSRHDGATVVPASALARREGKQGVFLADMQARKARFVPVTVGVTEGDVAEVLSPALSGSVIVMGQHLLEDGSAITVPEQSSGAGQAGAATSAPAGAAPGPGQGGKS